MDINEDDMRWMLRFVRSVLQAGHPEHMRFIDPIETCDAPDCVRFRVLEQRLKEATSSDAVDPSAASPGTPPTRDGSSSSSATYSSPVPQEAPAP